MKTSTVAKVALWFILFLALLDAGFEVVSKTKHNRECDWVLCCGGYSSYLNQNKNV